MSATTDSFFENARGSDQKNPDWTDANQRYLCAKFALLKIRLGGKGDAVQASNAVEQSRGTLPSPASIDVLAGAFALSAFERELLLLCAGVEMDAELARCCASVQGLPQRSHVSFGLALGALEDPHWSALSPSRPLRRWRLIEAGEESGLATSRLRIDERVLHYLAGLNELDARLRPLLRAFDSAPLMADTHVGLVNTIRKMLTAGQRPVPVLQLIGDDASGQEDVAGEAAASLGLWLHVVSAEDIPTGVHEADAFATLWAREAALLPGALLIACPSVPVPPVVSRLLERLDGIVFAASAEPLTVRRPSHRYSVTKPDPPEQKQLWERALGAHAGRLNGALDAVASQFSLCAQDIRSASRAVTAHMATSSSSADTVVWDACRTVARNRLDDMVQRIEPAAHWDDLVLPNAQKATLQEIATHVRHRLKVYQEWGFASKGMRGLGISALFSGESGTGKTMAAEVLANELHLDLYRIDLSSVVSKYIGETEKNLRRVFDAAEESGAILLFDEADALFGKRSEVKDSHDRYANIEVSYLLQRMEAYRGLAVLTTNMRTALDTAFQRRLRFIVQFPFPNAGQREAIWRGIFPTDTPTAALDHTKLARLHVAGGHIRNIALNAAFLAAEAGGPVSMTHLLHSAHSEAAKRERQLSDAETRGWV